MSSLLSLLTSCYSVCLNASKMLCFSQCFAVFCIFLFWTVDLDFWQNPAPGPCWQHGQHLLQWLHCRGPPQCCSRFLPGPRGVPSSPLVCCPSTGGFCPYFWPPAWNPKGFHPRHPPGSWVQSKYQWKFLHASDFSLYSKKKKKSAWVSVSERRGHKGPQFNWESLRYGIIFTFSLMRRTSCWPRTACSM